MHEMHVEFFQAYDICGMVMRVFYDINICRFLKDDEKLSKKPSFFCQ